MTAPTTANLNLSARQTMNLHNDAKLNHLSFPKPTYAKARSMAKAVPGDERLDQRLDQRSGRQGERRPELINR
jgi:hypothetical protein